MGSCCGSHDSENQEALLGGQRDDNANSTKATGAASSVESTAIQKNITAKAEYKEPEQPNPTDEREEKEEKQVVFTQKTDVLPGQCLIEQTFDLEKDLQTLKERYKGQYKPLLKREIVSLEKDNVNVTPQNSFKIMQFNMLADGLCTAYRWVGTEKTFLNVDPLCLQWTYRSLRLLEEIHRFEPDIIALEECDQLPFLMKYLTAKGYNSFAQSKTKSPIKHVIAEIIEERKLEKESISVVNDGIAIIYKTDKFECSEDSSVQCIDMKDNSESVMGLAVPLKMKSNGKEALFVCTHLKSTKSAEGEQIRERQINSLFKDLVKNDQNLPIVLCCDLNANPVVNKKGYEPLCYNSITSKDGLGFESVYKLANGSEPDYTTFKLREHGIDKHCIDYIFVRDGSWEISALLDIPKASEDLDALIPNWHYPSDHFSLLAQLTFK